MKTRIQDSSRHFLVERLSVAVVVALAASLGCATGPEVKKKSSPSLGPIGKQVAALDQPPEVLAFFQGTFDVLAIDVVDVNEHMTIRLAKDAAHFEGGLADDADFRIQLQTQNLNNMTTYAADGKLDKYEAFRIMAVLFSPLTQQNLDQPMWTDQTVHALSGIEDQIHVYLLDDTGGEAASHTLTYDGKWTVEPGIHGEAGRTFRMTADDALEFQRRSFTAIKTASPAGWASFARWYRDWRDNVSTSS